MIPLPLSLPPLHSSSSLNSSIFELHPCVVHVTSSAVKSTSHSAAHALLSSAREVVCLLFSSSIDPVSTPGVPRFRPLSLLRLPIAFRLGHDLIRRRKLARVLRLSFEASLFEAYGVDGC